MEKYMKNYLIVVDMQNDFISGALGSEAAKAILPRVTEILREFSGEVIFTRDTHSEEYLDTHEGKHLPVPHCIRGSHGWQIADELLPFAENAVFMDKPTFGSVALAEYLRERARLEPIGKITLVGVCTDICVISNALLLRAYLPEADIEVMADATAGVTAESHRAALTAMASCQIDII